MFKRAQMVDLGERNNGFDFVRILMQRRTSSRTESKYSIGSPTPAGRGCDSSPTRIYLFVLDAGKQIS